MVFSGTIRHIRDKLKRQGDIDMKRFSILTLILMTMLIISACGAKGTPPPAVSAVDMQNTSVAVAQTMIAETQAAIPTATPPPPTETFTDTPAPTNTFLPLSELTLTPAPNGNSGGADSCENKVLPALLQGETVKIRINNSTRATLAVSVYLNQTAPQGECGYRPYTLEPGQSVVINDLIAGCYTLWAWNPEPKDYFIVTNGTNCLDSSYQWAFDISTRDIKLR